MTELHHDRLLLHVQAILKVYQAEVVSALRGSCLRLLHGIEQHLKWAALRAAEGSTAMSMAAQLEWLLPLLLILFLVRNKLLLWDQEV
jgi:hypothetical protein